MSPAPRRPRASGSGSSGSSRSGGARSAGSRATGSRASGSRASGARKQQPTAAAPPAGAAPETDAPARAEWIGLHSLSPAPGSRRPRKRVGRGEGSGTGKTAGRGQKGYGARSGAKRRVRFEGGQMPVHMRMRKLRGPHMKKSMPFEPFRTHTQPVNVGDLDARFDSGAEVTLAALRDRGLGTRAGVPVKVLAKGELSKPLTVHAHAFSAAARERIEAAGGTCQLVDA